MKCKHGHDLCSTCHIEGIANNSLETKLLELAEEWREFYSEDDWLTDHEKSIQFFLNKCAAQLEALIKEVESE